jgi:hypothetical protein
MKTLVALLLVACVTQAHAIDIWLTDETADCPQGTKHAIVVSNVRDRKIVEDGCWALNSSPIAVPRHDEGEPETHYSAGVERSIGQTLAAGELLSVVIVRRGGIVVRYIALLREVTGTKGTTPAGAAAG